MKTLEGRRKSAVAVEGYEVQVEGRGEMLKKGNSEAYSGLLCSRAQKAFTVVRWSNQLHGVEIVNSSKTHLRYFRLTAKLTYWVEEL